MHNVLLVYKQLEIQFDDAGEIIVSDGMPVHVLSYDKSQEYKRLQQHHLI